MSNDNDAKNTFTTSTGFDVKLRPVSHVKISSALKKVEKDFRAEGKQVDKPTYIVELAGGGSQEFDFDETYVEESEDPEVKAKWAAYHQDNIDLLQVKRERELKVIMRLGTDFALPVDDSWIEFHEYDGLEVPDHPIERLEHYLVTEVYVTAADIKTLSTRVIELAADGMDEDAKEAVLDSFRDTVEDAEREAAQELEDSEG